MSAELSATAKQNWTGTGGSNSEPGIGVTAVIEGGSSATLTVFSPACSLLQTQSRRFAQSCSGCRPKYTHARNGISDAVPKRARIPTACATV